MALNVEITALCAQARVGRKTYHNARAGICEPTRDTVQRLHAALSRFTLRDRGDGRPLEAHFCYLSAIVIASLQLGAEPTAVMAHDPGRKATGSKEWLEASRVRRLALWIANGLMGQSQAELGRAAGMSRQAVRTAVMECDADEDFALGAIRDKLERYFRPWK